MSTSSIQEPAGNENGEEATLDTIFAAQTTALGEEISLQIQDSVLQDNIPQYTLNSLDIPVIEGVDPLTPAQNRDGTIDREVGTSPIMPSTRPSAPENLNTTPFRVEGRDFLHLPRLPVPYTESRHSTVPFYFNDSQRSFLPSPYSERRTPTLPLPYSEARPSFLPFPYSEPGRQRSPDQRVWQEQHEQQDHLEDSGQQRYPHQSEDPNGGVERMRNALTYPTYPEMPRFRLGYSRGQGAEEFQRALERQRELQQLRAQSGRQERHTTDTPFPHSMNYWHSFSSPLQQPSQRVLRTSLSVAERSAPGNGRDVPSAHPARRTTQPTTIESSDSASRNRATIEPSQSSDLINSPVRYQNLSRAHVHVEVHVTGQGAIEGQQRNEYERQSEMQRSSLTQTAQVVTLPNPVPIRRHTVSQGDPQFAASHTHQEAEYVRTPDDLAASGTRRTAWRMATRITMEDSDTHLANYALRRSATGGVSPPVEAMREQRPDTDYRLRTLLDQFHSRAATPTPPARPMHLTARSQNWQILPEPARLLAGAEAHSENINGYSTRHTSMHARILSNNVFRSSSDIASPSPVNQWNTRNTPSSAQTLTRAMLESHARSPHTNPTGLPWHSLTLIQHIQTLQAEEAQTRLQAERRRQQRQHEQLHAAILESERLDRAVLNLALCNALSDARAIRAQADAADQATHTDSRSIRRHQRENVRGWVPSAHIVTAQERYELRGALARRDALGVRLGLLGALEECLGRGLGRWAFDVWVAQAAVGGSGVARGRIGAVWLGPSRSSDEQSIREWHLVPADGDDDGDDEAYGVGEGWVEWREPGRGVSGEGCFAVYDVFI